MTISLGELSQYIDIGLSPEEIRRQVLEPLKTDLRETEAFVTARVIKRIQDLKAERDILPSIIRTLDTTEAAYKVFQDHISQIKSLTEQLSSLESRLSESTAYLQTREALNYSLEHKLREFQQCLQQHSRPYYQHDLDLRVADFGRWIGNRKW